MSILALHKGIKCSQQFKNVNVACKFTAPIQIIKTSHKITINVLIKKRPTKLIAQREHP